MPKFRLKIANRSVKVSSQFKDAEFIRKLINEKIDRTEKRIVKMLRAEVEKAIRNHKVMRALINPQIGVRGYDLPAEFGLTPGEAQAAHEGVVRAILRSCKARIEKRARIKVVDGKPSVSVRVTTSFMNPEEYDSKLSGSKYYRESNGRHIEWMRWLLEGRRGNRAIYSRVPDITKYGIAYSLPGSKWKSRSRSGRALMIPEYRETRSGKKRNNHHVLAIRYFPYQYPEVAIPRPGFKNFIEEISRDPTFTAKLQARLDVIIRNYLIKR
jgi:hypothetical protein